MITNYPITLGRLMDSYQNYFNTLESSRKETDQKGRVVFYIDSEKNKVNIEYEDVQTCFRFISLLKRIFVVGKFEVTYEYFDIPDLVGMKYPYLLVEVCTYRSEESEEQTVYAYTNGAKSRTEFDSYEQVMKDFDHWCSMKEEEEKKRKEQEERRRQEQEKREKEEWKKNREQRKREYQKRYYEQKKAEREEYKKQDAIIQYWIDYDSETKHTPIYGGSYISALDAYDEYLNNYDYE